VRPVAAREREREREKERHTHIMIHTHTQKERQSQSIRAKISGEKAAREREVARERGCERATATGSERKERTRAREPTRETQRSRG